MPIKSASSTILQKNINFIQSHSHGQTIVLVGIMGVGKSTIGYILSQLLNFQFIDSDHEIESISQSSIPDIFDNYGEFEFRRLEEKVIIRLLNQKVQILSTGGGAFINHTIHEAIQQQAISVWLHSDLNILIPRLMRNQNRPLVKGKTSDDVSNILKDLLDKRIPFYEKANIHLNCDNQPPKILATNLIQKLAQFLQAKQHLSIT